MHVVVQICVVLGVYHKVILYDMWKIRYVKRRYYWSGVCSNSDYKVCTVGCVLGMFGTV